MGCLTLGIRAAWLTPCCFKWQPYFFLSLPHSQFLWYAQLVEILPCGYRHESVECKGKEELRQTDARGCSFSAHSSFTLTTTKAGDVMRRSCAACILPSNGTMEEANVVLQPLSYISGTLGRKKYCVNPKKSALHASSSKVWGMCHAGDEVVLKLKWNVCKISR